jgi:hypothetical protein
MANYVLVVNLGDLAGAKEYLALNELMSEFGFGLLGPEIMRPLLFSVTSTLPLGGIRRMVEDRISA